MPAFPVTLLAEPRRADPAPLPATGAGPGFWSTAFVVLGIVLYAGARAALSGADANEPDPGATNPLNTAAQLLLLLVSAGYCVRHPRRAAAALWRMAPVVLLIGMLAASSWWSQSPMHSFRRSISMVTLVLFVVFAQERLGTRRFMRVVVATMLVLCAASLAEAVLRPEIGYDVGEYANAIRGVFTQKNGFGAALLMGALALSFLVLDRGAVRWRDLGVLGVLLVMLVLSRSTTALVLTLVISGATVALLAVDRGGAWMAGAVILAGLGATAGLVALSVLGPSVVFDLLGKDESLTGRVYIWESVGWSIRARPWLGHGFAAYWLPGTNGAETVWQVMYWVVPSAHSGYLETLLDIGLIGAGMVTLVMLTTLVRSLVALGDGRRRRALWAMLFLVVYAFYNYSESALLQPGLGFLYWVLIDGMLAGRGARALAPGLAGG